MSYGAAAPSTKSQQKFMNFSNFFNIIIQCLCAIEVFLKKKKGWGYILHPFFEKRTIFLIFVNFDKIA